MSAKWTTRSLWLLGALGSAACAGPQSALQPEGSDAHGLYGLFRIFLVICAAVWVLVMLVLALALLRRRHPTADPLAQEPRRERRFALFVGAAVAATVLTIAGLTLLSYAATPDSSAHADAPLVIEIRGYQWWWQVTYDDPEPARSFITANEIHVPVGRPVAIALSAADVIHSFWVPNLSGKQDLIPGRDNRISFIADKPGVYRGQCSQFCGLQHAHMAIVVIAEPSADFEAWRNAQIAAAASPASAQQRQGHDFFMSHPCAACHTIRGTPAAGTLGPDLTHVASRLYIAAGLMPTTRGALAAWVADPQTAKPGNNMPAVPMSAADLVDVSAYLAALK